MSLQYWLLSVLYLNGICSYIVGDYKGKQVSKLYFCLVGLKLYAPVNNFSVMSGLMSKLHTWNIETDNKLLSIIY